MTDYKSILLYYSKGNTNTQIATICGCSRTTVIKTIKALQALKEQERSAKAQSAAIFILSTQKRKPVRIEPYRS